MSIKYFRVSIKKSKGGVKLDIFEQEENEAMVRAKFTSLKITKVKEITKEEYQQIINETPRTKYTLA